jgi:hypothetical protein
MDIKVVINKIKDSRPGGDTANSLEANDVIQTLKYLLLLTEQQEERIYELEKRNRLK